MSRTRAIDTIPGLTFVGSLIPSAMVERIRASQAPEQKPADYGIPGGLKLADEAARAFRIAEHLMSGFPADAGYAATVRHVEDVLKDVFGFGDLRRGTPPVALTAGEGRVPVIVAPAGTPLDKLTDTIPGAGKRAPAVLLQDHLNAHEEALWGLVTDGRRIRLMRDNRSLTRPAWIEADLAEIVGGEDFASFLALWLLIHRSRFGTAGAPVTDCPLERWREEGSREGALARDRLAGQVEEALAVLGTGFLSANPALAQRLHGREIDVVDWFNELLRLVYRLIFLMVAEDRDLLHPPRTAQHVRKLYAKGYSLARLRELSVTRSAADRHHDRWEGLKILFRALARGEPRLGLPALGGLFVEGSLPTLDDTSIRLSNRDLLRAIRLLGWIEEDGALQPINWRRMETEELGSVYETLLELNPQLGEDSRSLRFAYTAAEKKGSQRKTTGSYYTPHALVETLLDEALDPVLDRAEAAEDPEAALLALKVIDPAMGSGHFLIAAAHRIAGRLARHRGGGAADPAEQRHALRDVVARCIHGVDRNPMAVELARVALWIESVDPGRPLGFLDANLRTGDSLLGLFDLSVLEDGIPDAAYKPLTGDEKKAANDLKKRNRSEREGQGILDFHAGGGIGAEKRAVIAEMARLRAMPENTPAEIAAKERAFRRLRESEEWQRLKLAADIWVGAFLLPKTRATADAVPTTAHVRAALAGRPVPEPVREAAEKACRDARALHWPLEFPDVMAKGGFDVVLGNPPWERIKLQEKEFFASRAPEIATAANKAARDRLIRALREAEPGTPQRALFDEFVAAKRLSEATSAFVRTPGDKGGRFAFTGTGDVNTYALFAELFANLSRQRAGVIVPTGIATDATTAPFFAHVVATRRLARLVDFENRERLFPAVDSRMKFCLLTLGHDEDQAQFAFFLTDPAQLAEPARNFTLSPEDIAAINPNTRTAPVFRSRRDAELTAKIYRNAPVLIEEGKGKDGNPWGVSFMAMFHMSNDSHLFRTAAELQAEGFVREGTDWVRPGTRPAQGALAIEGTDARHLPLTGGGTPLRYVPLYEAKMIHQFDHRWATYGDDGKTSRDMTLAEKQDPNAEPQPRYWVPEDEVTARLTARGWTRGWLMGWRDITNATNERTVIASVFPRVGCGDTLLLEFPEVTNAQLYVGVVANQCALPFDYASRQKIGGTHLKYNVFKQLPILPPAFYTEPRLAFITPRVLELTYTSHALAPFARDLGHDGPPYPWDEDHRAALRAELDAFYARAYGLTRDELCYILDPAEVMGADYPSETFRVLKEKEIRKHGEYRTARLVLEAWDRMEADGTFGRLGL